MDSLKCDGSIFQLCHNIQPKVASPWSGESHQKYKKVLSKKFSSPSAMKSDVELVKNKISNRASNHNNNKAGTHQKQTHWF
jgi:hypothetical protein